MLCKACPKCRGDLGLERDMRDGAVDIACLQCGYIARPDERARLLSVFMRRNQQPAPRLVPYRTVRRAS